MNIRFEVDLEEELEGECLLLEDRQRQGTMEWGMRLVEGGRFEADIRSWRTLNMGKEDGILSQKHLRAQRFGVRELHDAREYREGDSCSRL